MAHSSVAILNYKRHGDLALSGQIDFSFARDSMLVPVWAGEMVDASRHFPIAFVRQQGVWAAVAVTSLFHKENSFVGGNGEWLGAYTPAALRSHPFTPVTTDAESGDGTLLGIVEDDPRVVPVDAAASTPQKPLFTESGEPSAFTKEMKGLIATIVHHRRLTHAYVSELEKRALLTPWTLPVLDRASGDPVNLDGVFRVDEEAFDGLSDDVFLDLRRAGGLPFVYAHMMSTDLLSRVHGDRQQQRRAPSEPPRQTERAETASARELFQFY